MSIYEQIIILLACYKVIITFASLALEGVHQWRTQKVRPVEVLTHSQGYLEAKGNLEQPIRHNNYAYMPNERTITNIL